MFDQLKFNKNELTNRLNRELEDRLPKYGLNWSSAITIARLYRILGNPKSAQRYFKLAAKQKEEVDLSERFKLSGGIAEHIRSISHLALLYHYAGQEEKAAVLFEYVVAEATLLLQGPDSGWRRGLLETLAPVYLIQGNYDKFVHYLAKLEALYLALKEQYDNYTEEEKPDEPEDPFPPAAYEAIQLMKQAIEMRDDTLADQAIKFLGEYIVTNRFISSVSTLADWDILEILVEVRDRLASGGPIKSGEGRAPLNQAGIQARLNQIIEAELPEFGLNWGTAERLARLYKGLGDLATAKRYFKRAAELKQEQLVSTEALFETNKRRREVIESYIHLALLYRYAEAEELEDKLLGQLAERTATEVAFLSRLESLRFDRFHILMRVIFLHLVTGDIGAASRYLADLRELQAEMPEGDPIIFLPPLEAIEMMLQAKATGDQALTNQALDHLSKYIEVSNYSIETIGRVSERDILELLQEIKAQI